MVSKNLKKSPINLYYIICVGLSIVVTCLACVQLYSKHALLGDNHTNGSRFAFGNESLPDLGMKHYVANNNSSIMDKINIDKINQYSQLIIEVSTYISGILQLRRMGLACFFTNKILKNKLQKIFRSKDGVFTDRQIKDMEKIINDDYPLYVLSKLYFIYKKQDKSDEEIFNIIAQTGSIIKENIDNLQTQIILMKDKKNKTVKKIYDESKNTHSIDDVENNLRGKDNFKKLSKKNLQNQLNVLKDILYVFENFTNRFDVKNDIDLQNKIKNYQYNFYEELNQNCIDYYNKKRKDLVLKTQLIGTIQMASDCSDNLIGPALVAANMQASNISLVLTALTIGEAIGCLYFSDYIAQYAKLSICVKNRMIAVRGFNDFEGFVKNIKNCPELLSSPSDIEKRKFNSISILGKEVSLPINIPYERNSYILLEILMYGYFFMNYKSSKDFYFSLLVLKSLGAFSVLNSTRFNEVLEIMEKNFQDDIFIKKNNLDSSESLKTSVSRVNCIKRILDKNPNIRFILTNMISAIPGIRLFTAIGQSARNAGMNNVAIIAEYIGVIRNFIGMNSNLFAQESVIKNSEYMLENLQKDVENCQIIMQEKGNLDNIDQDIANDNKKQEGFTLDSSNEILQDQILYKKK